MLSKQRFNIREYSVTRDNPNDAHNEDYIKREILKPRLDACSILAVIITPETKDSEWVNWEVEYAVKHGKRVVGIWGNGSKGVDIPEPLKDVCHALVTWSSDKIQQAIEGDNSVQQDFEGKPRPNEKIPTAKCH